MTRSLLFLFLIACAVGRSAPPQTATLRALPALQTQVSCDMEGIPWGQSTEPFEVELRAAFEEDVELVEMIQGEWRTTLHRCAYRVTNVAKGTFDAPRFSFLATRRFPQPSSSIRLKELWPFGPQRVGGLIFRLRREGNRFRIVSIS